MQRHAVIGVLSHMEVRRARRARAVWKLCCIYWQMIISLRYNIRTIKNTILNETWHQCLDQPVLFVPRQPIGLCTRMWRRGEVWWLSYPPSAWVRVDNTRRSFFQLHCVPWVVVRSTILECPLRFWRSLGSTRKTSPFLPEQSVSLKLTPKTPWSVEVPCRHVVFQVISRQR